MEELDPIKVKISRFHGIEINDFAVSVAQTALWIAENQTMKETEQIVNMQLDFLPLTTAAHIVEGNALRINWNDVLPASECDCIMGNPPFVGASNMNKDQKSDIINLIPQKGGTADYVAAWYVKAAEYMQQTAVRAAFVSTNSITQGEQVAVIWKPLTQKYRVTIDLLLQRSFGTAKLRPTLMFMWSSLDFTAELKTPNVCYIKMVHAR